MEQLTGCFHVLGVLDPSDRPAREARISAPQGREAVKVSEKPSGSRWEETTKELHQEPDRDPCVCP